MKHRHLPTRCSRSLPFCLRNARNAPPEPPDSQAPLRPRCRVQPSQPRRGSARQRARSAAPGSDVAPAPPSARRTHGSGTAGAGGGRIIPCCPSPAVRAPKAAALGARTRVTLSGSHAWAGSGHPGTVPPRRRVPSPVAKPQPGTSGQGRARLSHRSPPASAPTAPRVPRVPAILGGCSNDPPPPPPRPCGAAPSAGGQRAGAAPLTCGTAPGFLPALLPRLPPGPARPERPGPARPLTPSAARGRRDVPGAAEVSEGTPGPPRAGDTPSAGSHRLLRGWVSL